ncbi:MAG TPA: phosphate acyltransferase PlsX [Firmicutes bacterium]|nr:phosphate acyltransferase PlsX [Bacillota bacterium]
MFRIAVDVLGGDGAPDVPIEAAIAVGKEQNVEIALLGPEEIIRDRLRRISGTTGLAVKIVHAPRTISGSEAQVKAIRTQRDSSIVRGFELLRSGEVDALVSAGSTGALMAGGLLIGGRMPGISRPALPVCAPSVTGGRVVLLDVGVNPDAKPHHLLQYAVMGIVYSRGLLKVRDPAVYLLNIGEEEGKGNELARAAYRLMRCSLGNAFRGNIEARDILSGKADVVVTDGFTGNVTLKCIEGVAAILFGALKKELKATFRTKIAGILARPAFVRVKNALDYSEYGGVPLLGLNTLCIKCHGSSNAKAFANGIRVALSALESRFLDAIREGVAGLKPSEEAEEANHGDQNSD